MSMLAAVLLLGPSLCLPALAAPKGEVTFYVGGLTGRDEWSGRLPEPNRKQTDGPFMSLARALDAVREERARGATRPVTVLLRRGTHALPTKPLTLTPEHSGTPEGPTTLAAYPGEQPLLTGGWLLTGWESAPQGLVRRRLPEVERGEWFFRTLWVNGERRSRPRLPKQGVYALAGGAQPENSAFHYAPDHLRADWANRDDIEVVVLQYWTEARLRIASLDEAQRLVTFTGGSWRPLYWSTGYYAENVAEALTEPGEWYLDRTAGTLSYLPTEGEAIEQAEVWAPRAEQLLRLEGDVAGGRFVEHVILRGLRFAHCAWPLPKAGLAYPQAELPVGAAIYARGARNCAFEQCEIAHCDSWGLELGPGCRDNRVTDSTFRDLGAGGLKVGEPEACTDDALETCRTTIAGNTFTDGAQTYFGGPAVWIGNSSHNTVSRNEISGAWQWAVSVGWRWAYYPMQRAHHNLVESNHIHHLGSALGSHSSIYTLGIQPGTVIRNNSVHHCAGYGIGLDQSSTGIVVEENLIYRNAHGLHLNWDCLGNIVRNNLFAFNGDAQWTRYGDAPQATDMNANVVERNLCVWDNGRLYVESAWPNYRMAIDYNLYYDASGAPVTFLGFPLEEWRTKGPWLDQHSVIADPLFVDPDRDDFRLQPASPAFALGFREFPAGPARTGP